MTLTIEAVVRVTSIVTLTVEAIARVTSIVTVAAKRMSFWLKSF